MIRLLIQHDSFPNCEEDVGSDGEVGRRELSLGVVI